ncbi:hypothetical protein M0804_015223 [Polistes exclamans]|nr:hypothetical protein M0804_015223 [Polistes exclamans]
MGKILHQTLENNIFKTQVNKEYWKYTPDPVKENPDNILYLNRSIYSDRTVTHNRPDTKLSRKKEKTAHLIDYAVVNSHNIQSTYPEKIKKISKPNTRNKTNVCSEQSKDTSYSLIYNRSGT